MTRHVVFGTGQVGRLVVDELVARNIDVTAVNRSVGDATDVEFTTRVSTGADVVYFCLNSSHYDKWDVEFPPLQRGVLAGARASGARLVVLDNLYSYGPTAGTPLVESLPPHPTSRKAATRAAMTDELLATTDVDVVIGRASDYFGPGTTQSALGETVFGRALAGKRAQVMGKPSTPHSYSYTPDVARALVTLGLAPEAHGVWHLPIAETRTTRQLLRTDHPHSMRAYARMIGSPVSWSCLTSMGHSLTTGQPASLLLDTGGTWAYLAARPHEATVFNDSMLARAHADAALITAFYDFGGADLVLDIGGGRGQILDAILEANPSARGVLFDLPAVTAEAVERDDDRLRVHPGDFFSDELPNYDVGLLVQVLHDWPDPDAAAILRAARSATQPRSTLLIMETLMCDGGDSWRAKVLDVFMLAITGGRERTREEFAALLAASGFELARVIPLPTGSSIVEARAI